VVDENMANAARVHAVENGEDLAGYTMIAFGGAAPLHAARLCEKLGVQRCLVPQGAGVGSAIGFLRAPFSFEANRSVFMRMSSFDPALVRVLFAEMASEATKFVRSCDAVAPILAEYKVYMRYAGQGWEIPVPLTQAPSRDDYLALFETLYARLFGRSVAGMDVEITVWSVNAATAKAQSERADATSLSALGQSAIGQRDLFDAALGRAGVAQVFARDTLDLGALVQGPALITEEETTVVLTHSRSACILSDGCIDIFAKET
jgi:N-methylhydantoinase A